jgi:hypothetical protein
MVRALASISELVSAGRLVPQPADAAALRAVLVAGRYETAPEPATADLDRARLDVSLLLDVAQTAIDGIS